MRNSYRTFCMGQRVVLSGLVVIWGRLEVEQENVVRSWAHMVGAESKTFLLMRCKNILLGIKGRRPLYDPYVCLQSFHSLIKFVNNSLRSMGDASTRPVLWVLRAPDGAICCRTSGPSSEFFAESVTTFCAPWRGWLMVELLTLRWTGWGDAVLEGVWYNRSSDVFPIGFPFWDFRFTRRYKKRIRCP